MNDDVKSKRTFKTNSLSDLAKSVNNRAFRRYGFAKSDIHLHWSEIVGPVLSKSSLPERLVMPKEQDSDRAGVLHVRVEGSYAPEMQHLEHLVIDRINSYYGFKAVERMIFHHGKIDHGTLEKKYIPPILSDSQKKELDLHLKDIKDDDLRKSLYKVGAEILGGQKPEKTKKAKRFTRRGMGNGQSNQK
ncbi:MAG: DciA family protein [Emcibacteraceae bacterium]|nr:DciA family protein [Emcibacteraceae bacterium]